MLAYGQKIALRLLLPLVVAALALGPAVHGAAGSLGADDVLQAYKLLEENFVDPVDSRVVLDAAWHDAYDFADHAGADVAGVAAPSLGDSTEANLGAFRDAFEELTRASAPRTGADDLVLAAIGGIGRSVNDDHTGFVRPAAWQLTKSGLRIATGYSSLPTARGSLVWDVQVDSPASVAGIYPGDLVVAINGASLLPGSSTRPPAPAAGVTVDVEVLRPAVGDAHLSLTPETRKQLFYAARLLDGNVAYVRIYSFQTLRSFSDLRALVEDLNAAIADLETHAPNGWILDLRANSGGSLSIAQFVSSRFGLSGVMNTAKGRTRNGTYNSTAVAAQATGPLAILINGQSASASEIVAGALHDGRAAYLIGEKTSGRVNEARYFEVAGGALQVTTARIYVGKSGRYLDGIGIPPDKVVHLDSAALAAGHDAQIDEALQYIADAPR